MKKLLAAIACCTLILSGCSSSSQSTEDTTKETTTETKEETKKDTTKTFGEESDTAYKLTINNKTGQAITALKVANDVDNKYSDDYLDGETIENGEQFILYVEPTDAKLDQDDDEIAVETQYLIKIKLEDGTKYELSSLAFDSVDTFSIKVEDGVSFIVYRDEDGNKVSTKDAVLAQQQADQQAEQEETTEETVEETYDQTYVETPTYDNSYDYNTYYDTSGGSTNTSGSSEGCLDGI